MSGPVYLLGQIKVKDFDVYMADYGAPVVGQLLACGAEILAASFSSDGCRLEGEWPECWNVLFKFPSQNVLDSWWNSAEYEPFKYMRQQELTDGGHVIALPAFDSVALGL